MIDFKQQRLLCITICLLLAFWPITSSLNILVRLYTGEGFIYDTVICLFIFMIYVIRSLIVCMKDKKADVILFVFFFAVAYIMSYLVYPQNRIYMFSDIKDIINNPLYLLMFSLIGYILMRHIVNYSLLKKYLVISSVFTVVLSVLGFFLMNLSGSQASYMTFSYSILLQTVCLLIIGLENRNMYQLIIGIIGMSMIFFAGARGAIVCLGISFVLYLFFKKDKIYKKFIFVILSVMVIIIIFFNFSNILTTSLKITNDLGIQSRTISMALSGDFSDDTGRENIQSKIIKNFSVVGSGLYGDRSFVGSKLEGSYAHNIFIEIISQFGYIFGVIIVLFIGYVVLRCLLSKNNDFRLLCIIFISSGLAKLLFSGSYLRQEPAFYILMGLCVSQILSYNKITYTSKLKSR